MISKKDKFGNFMCHIYLIILTIIAVFPLLWILLSSVKTSGELTANPTSFLPKNFTLENFIHVIKDLGFDSLDIMKFIVELEDEFNIMFEPEELEYENIINIKNLCDLINSKII